MIKSNEILIIFGKKGSGKTFYAMQHSLTQTRIIVIDPTDDYKGGLYFESNSDKLWDWLYYAGNAPHKHFRAVLKFTSIDEIETFIGMLRDFVLTEKQLTQFTLLTDEAHQIVGARDMNPDYRDLILMGRHARMNHILITQRPYLINRTVTANADTLVSFKVTEQRDLKFLADEGFNPDELRELPDVKEYLANPGRFDRQYIRIDR